MFQNTILIPCLHTCDFMHDHGTGFLELQWLKSDPLAISGTAMSMQGVPMAMKKPDEKPFFVVARDVVHTAVRSGKSYGCPVVGDGDVTFKVMRQSLTTLSVRWAAGYVMLVDRDLVSRWIDETYTIVGVQAEDAVIDVDSIIEKILKAGEQK